MPEPRSDAELRALVDRRVRAIMYRRVRMFRAATAVALVVGLPTIGMVQYKYGISSAASELLTAPKELFLDQPEQAPTSSPRSERKPATGSTSRSRGSQPDRRTGPLSTEPGRPAPGPNVPLPGAPGAPPPAPSGPVAPGPPPAPSPEAVPADPAAPGPTIAPEADPEESSSTEAGPREPGSGETSSGEPPTTGQPDDEPPVVEPRITEPPATEPPVTEPPATVPPVTEPPVTEPPDTTPPPPVTAWASSQVDAAIAQAYSLLSPAYGPLSAHSCGFSGTVAIGTYSCTALGTGSAIVGSFTVTVTASTNGPDAEPVVTLS